MTYQFFKVMGQELNGSLGSWVTLSDPFPALVQLFNGVVSDVTGNPVIHMAAAQTGSNSISAHKTV